MDAAEPRAVLELADPRPGDRALDAGCGTGLYTRRLGERGATLMAASLERNDAGRLRVRAPRGGSLSWSRRPGTPGCDAA